MSLIKKNLNTTKIFPTKKELKEFKKQYQIKTFQKLFFQKDSQIYFYFYEKFLPEDRKYLQEKNIKSFYLKKKLFKNFSNKFLNEFFLNIVANNTLFLYSTDKNQNFFTIPTSLKDLKNLFLLGFFFKNKFFRPSELKIFQTKNLLEIQKSILKIFILQKSILIKNILIKK